MGAIVDLCDDDDDSPLPPPQQTAAKKPRKRLFGCIAGEGTEREPLSPCGHNEGTGFRVDDDSPLQESPKGRSGVGPPDPLSPMRPCENRPLAPKAVISDKVAARKAVLERKAAEKKAKEAAAAAADASRCLSPAQPHSPPQSPQMDREGKQQQKQEQAAAKKASKDAEKAAKAAQKEADKAEKAAQKEQVRTAKAAESRARGTKADQEVTVLLDTSIGESKSKRMILEALEGHEVKFAHEVQAGRLPGWSTITWKRNNSSLVAPGGAADVPYVMIVLDDTEARALFASDASVKALLDSVIAAYGEVSVSLLLIGFDRHLVAQDRRDHTHAVRTGEVAAACGSKKSSLLHRMLTLHFKVEGITYRDCDDAQQAAEHVVGITAAIAKQAYKGGYDVLAAFTKNSKGDRLEGTAATYNLTERQKTCAKTLCALEWGPKQACAVAQQLQTFGPVAQQYAVNAQQTCQSIAVMKTDTGRNVGPQAAKKLHFFLTCEDPDAPFD